MDFNYPQVWWNLKSLTHCALLLSKSKALLRLHLWRRRQDQAVRSAKTYIKVLSVLLWREIRESSAIDRRQRRSLRHRLCREHVVYVAGHERLAGKHSVIFGPKALSQTLCSHPVEAHRPPRLDLALPLSKPPQLWLTLSSPSSLLGSSISKSHLLSKS